MEKTKIAILGGGLGSMAAAYELSCTEALRDRFEITVYQQGWRLGGKGASGRNRAYGERIEEHGLHAFLGFYENAFRLMRDVYADYAALHPKARWTSWRDAFEPQRQLSIEEWVPRNRSASDADGRWATWNLRLPPLPGEPGDGKSVPLLEKLVQGGVEMLVDFLRELVTKEPRALLHLASDLVTLEAKVLGDFLRGEFHDALDALSKALRRFEEESALDDDVRRLVLALELGSAILRGLVRDVVPLGAEAGFAYIDRWDFVEWLERHGASPRVAFWGPVRALYDLGFAYEGGVEDRAHARAAAGVALRILLLLGLGYKDAPLFKMKAGMGDTIFAPLYEVLKARGVKFAFFHRVTNLELSPTKNLVARIHLSKQVELSQGGTYEPLRYVKGLPCWPSEPRWEQIVDGTALSAKLEAEGLTLESAWCAQSVETPVLELGRDFDRVVLGISVAALRDVASELIDANLDWQVMMATTRTVSTQAMQLWLDRDLAELGWKAGPTFLTGYAAPFDTWADMSHLLPEEDWPPTTGPKNLAYLCSALPDPPVIPPFTDTGYPKRRHEEVFRNAQAWLGEDAGHLWPKATLPDHPSALDLALLHDPVESHVGVERLRAQYVRANVDPTERYVLSVPGSIDKRLRSGKSGFLNVVLAGDWVVTSLNGGCAESAIEGGLRAAHALAGEEPRPFVERLVL